MGWLAQFKFGRPGFEIQFDLNPEGMNIVEQPIDALYRNVAGDQKRSIIKSSAPSITINSSYLMKAQRDQFASMAGITDTFLSFQTRDDWSVVLEGDLPSTISNIVIQNTSATKLDQALISAGFAGHITITGVFDNPAGTGTNYYTGGAYAGATRTITLGTPLIGITNRVFVSYNYKGWLVSMRNMAHSARGGWVDRFQYSFELTGV